MSTNNKKGHDLTTILAVSFAAAIVITLLLYGVIAFVSFGFPSMHGDKGQESGQAAAPQASDETPAAEILPAEDGTEEGTTEEKVTIREGDALPETAARDESIEIALLSGEDLGRIAAEVNGSAQTFSTDGERDSVNRPAAVNDFLTTMREDGAYAVCYASDMDTKKVAFTFRASQEGNHTGEVLDILDNYRIKSTFYITHYYAANNADLVRRMITDGHEIGNQSYTCPSGGVTTLSLDDQMRDAFNMQNYVQQAFGYKMTKYNFCDDQWSEASAVLMSQMGYEIAFHSVAYDDADPEREIDAEATLSMLKDALHPGAVYCFHMTNPVTAQILPGLIEYCQSEGYTITQLN